MEKVLEVRPRHPPEEKNMACAVLSLPAMPYELKDALDKVRVSQGGDMTVKITQFAPDADFLADYMEEGIHKVPSLFLMNALAEKIARMNPPECRTFADMVRTDAESEAVPVSTARLYDLASSMDCWPVVSEASRDFTPREPDYAVLLEVRRREHTASLKMPADPEEMAAVLNVLAAADWPDVTFRCVDCGIPALAGAIAKDGNAVHASHAARILKNLSGRQIPVYQALLAARGVPELRQALEMIDWLDKYILTPEYASPTDVGLSHLRNLVGDDEAEQMLPYVDLHGFGESMIRRFHYIMTPYSAIEHRDGEPLWETFEAQRKSRRKQSDKALPETSGDVLMNSGGALPCHQLWRGEKNGKSV